MACTANTTCRKCGYGASDLELSCGCQLHVRCCPLNLIISNSSPSINGEFIGIPHAISAQAVVSCPFCFASVGGIRILPLDLNDLDKAVQVRKATCLNQNGKRNRAESEEDAVKAESCFLLSTTLHAPSNDAHRTGRWSPEEVAFVDYIISMFDSGTLAIPHGVKLNDLLGSVLMCKSSRLTKKMKNAKLSTRSYVIKNRAAMTATSCTSLSNLQERFLSSIQSESCQLELRFNMAKLWRTHFSNLCLQIDYKLLNARDWIATLEQLEGKASEAEESIRKARRRRMSIALKTDVGEAANAGVYIGGMSARDANMQPPPPPPVSSSNNISRKLSTSSLPKSASRTNLKREYSEVSMSDSEKQQATTAAATNTSSNNNNTNMEDDDEFLAALEMTASGQHNPRSRLRSEDMDFGLLVNSDDENDDSMYDPLSMMPHIDDSLSSMQSNCGPFLEQVGQYMENNQVPFQYADVWVPSFMGEDGQATSSHNNDLSKLRLFPAGHATRSDMDATVRSQLNEFGSYSAHFSFAPGHGLPGRVYTTGMASWETRIHETDPSVFERAGGAHVYGIKTAVGIPLVADGIGRIVVALYSTYDLAKDNVMLSKFLDDFKGWNPEPKWKLVIDLGNSTKADKQVMASAVPTHMVHFSHPKSGAAAAAPSVGGSTPAAASSQGSTTAQGYTSTTQALTAKMIVHQHAPTKSTTTTAVDAPSASKAASATSADDDDDDMEQAIASLLGDCMPTSESPAAALLPHFMSLRLMLLRVRERRSAEENEKLDILKRSFVDYSKAGRAGSELACLLAKDWMFLQPAFGMTEASPQSNATAPPVPPPPQQQSLAMPATMSTQTNLSMPTDLPVPLPAYSLPPTSAAAAPASGGMKMIVHQHAPRSRSISASSESSTSRPQFPSADIVPDG